MHGLLVALCARGSLASVFGASALGYRGGLLQPSAHRLCCTTAWLRSSRVRSFCNRGLGLGRLRFRLRSCALCGGVREQHSSEPPSAPLGAPGRRPLDIRSRIRESCSSRRSWTNRIAAPCRRPGWRAWYRHRPGSRRRSRSSGRPNGLFDLLAGLLVVSLAKRRNGKVVVGLRQRPGSLAKARRRLDGFRRFVSAPRRIKPLMKRPFGRPASARDTD